MKRKYIDDLKLGDNRPDKYCQEDKERMKLWMKQRDKYGFDSREMWNLDVTFYFWLYERLMYFLECEAIDLDYHKFEYNGETLTQRQCIEKIIKGCLIAIREDNYDIDEEKWAQVDEAAKLWALVLPAMWT